MLSMTLGLSSKSRHPLEEPIQSVMYMSARKIEYVDTPGITVANNLFFHTSPTHINGSAVSVSNETDEHAEATASAL